MRKLLLLGLFFLIGVFSLAIQTLLIREYLISLEGNELAIGLFYAGWFLWVAGGATFVIWKKRIANFFLHILPLYPLAAILEFYLVQIIRKIAGIQPWELFVITKIIPVSLIINLPFSLLTGILFSSGCRFLKIKEESNSQIVSSAYIWESIGSFTAGVLITYLITKLFPPLFLILVVSVLFLILGFLTAINYKSKPSIFLHSVLILVFIFLLFRYQIFQKKFDSARWNSVFRKGKIIAQIYTPYQHLAIAEVKNQKVLLSNAKVLEALGDEISGDQLSALLCAMCNLPEKILLIGYGCENLIYSLLKYEIKQIFYVLPDRNYVNFLKNYLPQKIKGIFSNPKVKIFYTDPRNFLTDRNEKFDLIVLNLPDPRDSFLNKYYTREFYQILKTRLSDKGVVALKIISAENYIGSELKNYGSSIYYTLKSQFPKIVIVPGRINWFLAGGDLSPLCSDYKILVARYKKIMPLNSTFYPEGFYSLLPPERVKFLEQTYANNMLFERFKLINSDKKPLSYFLNLIVQFRYANSRLPLFMKSIFISGWCFFIFPLILIVILRIHYLKFIHNTSLARLTFSARTYQLFSGWSGFIYQLILIYLFQKKFGTIFHYIGLVNSIFMLGLFSGGFIGKFLITKLQPQKMIAGILTIQFLIYIISYPLLVKFLAPASLSIAWSIYILLFLTSGIITGISYPLAGNLLEKGKSEILNISGSLEALDHWGASWGAIGGGIFLIPLLGIYKSLLFLAFATILILILTIMDILTLPSTERELNPSKLSYPYIKTSYFLFGLTAWVVFSFNYLQNKEKLLSQPEIKIQSLKFQRLGKKLSPFPYYLGYRDNNLFYIFRTQELKTSGKGFGGDIDLIIVVDRQGIIKKIEIEKAQESKWQLDQIKSWIKNFEGKPLYNPFQLGKNIDAVTGATISANGVIAGITNTARKVKKLFGIQRGKEEKLMINPKEISRTSLLLGIIIWGLILSRRKKLSYKFRLFYLVAMIIITGYILKLQLNTANLLAILDLEFPSLQNLSLFILFVFPFIIGILWGRIYCGWFCPFGAIQEILSGIKPVNVSEALDRKLRFFKFILLSMIVILYFATGNQNIFIQEPLYQAYFGKIGIAKILLINIILFALFFPRFWCKYFCPLGAFLSLLNKIRLLKTAEIKKLISCDYRAKNSRDPECLNCNLCFKNER